MAGKKDDKKASPRKGKSGDAVSYTGGGCKRCAGTGSIIEQLQVVDDKGKVSYDTHRAKCPQCEGTGR